VGTLKEAVLVDPLEENIVKNTHQSHAKKVVNQGVEHELKKRAGPFPVIAVDDEQGVPEIHLLKDLSQLSIKAGDGPFVAVAPVPT
jgi:hypothetical protein